jgi:phosphoribosylanthranilate isomerase
MSVSVKICGLRTVKALEAAIGAGADYVGFVFFEPSPRNVSLKQAAKLARRAEDRVKTVALTVNASNAAIEAIAAEVRPAYFQLHGSENLARMAAIGALTNIPLLKAIKVADRRDITAARHFETAAAFLLFDAAAPPLPNALPGGNGVAFEWPWLAKASLRPDFMLSGGLNSGNVLQALGASGARAVDVSSGVETAPGVKSPALIRQFIRTAKSFEPARPVSNAAR